MTGDGTSRFNGSNWSADSEHGLQVFMVVSPTGFSDFSFGNYMIGGFESGNGLINTQSVGWSSDVNNGADKAAAIMACNYLAFAKKQNCSLAEIGNVLTGEQLQKSKVIFPIIID